VIFGDFTTSPVIQNCVVVVAARTKEQVHQ
jgi:hypothetical protein